MTAQRQARANSPLDNPELSVYLGPSSAAHIGYNAGTAPQCKWCKWRKMRRKWHLLIPFPYAAELPDVDFPALAADQKEWRLRGRSGAARGVYQRPLRHPTNSRRVLLHSTVQHSEERTISPQHSTARKGQSAHRAAQACQH
jgi:hypothetical protein